MKHESKPIRRKIRKLIFSCDQHTVYDQKGDEPSMIRPTPETANLIARCYPDHVRIAFLVDERSHRKDSYFLPDSVEFYAVKGDAKRNRELFPKQITEQPDETILISSNRMLRAEAVTRGMKAVPHPAMAALLIDGKTLALCEVTGLFSSIQKCPDFVPYFVRKSERSSRAIGALSPYGIASAAKLGLKVSRFPIDLSIQDPVLAKIDHWNEEVVNAIASHHVLAYYRHEVLLAVGSDEDNDTLDIHGEHGHNWFLMPDPGLLKDAPTENQFSGGEAFLNFENHTLLQTINPAHLEIVERHPGLRIDPGLLFPKCQITAAQFQEMVNRYSGVSPLDVAGNIVSREVRHPDNARVVMALLKELRDMGYCAWTHSFNYGTRTVQNVIAELPGRGYIKIKPEILDRIREVMRYPFPEPDPPPFRALEEILGKEWSLQWHKQSLFAWDKLRLAEIQLGLYPYPWWLCASRAGFGAKTILVGCHLDSTAAGSPGYNPATDPAPGADDDASGIAGTLAVAKFLIPFKGLLTHTVRFCFFNAEEVGMVGSQAYAGFLKSINTSVKAAICMDMIGYNSDAHRIFEVHAGYTDPAIRDLSLPIANQIADSATQLGKLAPAQIYKGTIPSSSSNRDTHDGAINRSDHSSFHAQGFPAVVVSEDFFINQASEPVADGNPNYHRSGDTVIDSAYGADIACAVARAVKALAT